MNTVYPVGYSVNGARERIDELLSDPGVLLIDTRIKPFSWNEDWRKQALEEKYAERYRWAGKVLGNKALGTGRIEIADPAKGVAGLVKYLHEGHDIILMCQCKLYAQCHVSHIVPLLQEKLPEIEVVRYEPSLGLCAVCGEPATHQSPSGRPLGRGCEKHGYCARCKTSLDHFVRHPFNETCFVCPCVAEYASRIQLTEETKQAKQATLF